jgi:hypothetical protein
LPPGPWQGDSARANERHHQQPLDLSCLSDVSGEISVIVC